MMQDGQRNNKKQGLGFFFVIREVDHANFFGDESFFFCYPFHQAHNRFSILGCVSVMLTPTCGDSPFALPLDRWWEKKGIYK
jgi:hypothetical protein